MIVTSPIPPLFEFLKSRAKVDWSEDLRLIGQVQEGALTAVVGYNGFMGKTCMIHVAGIGKRWINRELLWAAFDYPFNQCDLDVLIGLVRSSNKEALRLDKKLGFKVIHKIKDGFMEGDDLIILEMRRPQAVRWLALGEIYDGKRRARSATAA